MKITTNQVIAIAFLILAVIVMYLLLIRPRDIKARCHAQALEQVRNIESDVSGSRKLELIDVAYDLCLKKNGL